MRAAPDKQPLVAGRGHRSNATLSSRFDLTDQLAIIRVKPDGALMPFLPGQYAVLAIVEEVPDSAAPGEVNLGRLVRKAYTMASAPDDPQGLEFFITLVENGELTPKLWRLNPGDRLWLNPTIKGKFTLEYLPPGKDLLLFATGTGIAPYISMLRTYRGSPPWRRVVLFHGARQSSDLAYREELEAYSAADPRVRYFPSVSREPQFSTWPGLRGRITELFAQGVYQRLLGWSFSAQSCQIMLCGNPEMIGDFQQILEQHGFRPHSKKNPGQIHVERYW